MLLLAVFFLVVVAFNLGVVVSAAWWVREDVRKRPSPAENARRYTSEEETW